MLRGNNVIEFYRFGVVWFSKWDIGGEADLSKLYADDGRCRQRKVESEKRKEGPLIRVVYHAGTTLGVSLLFSL